MAWKQRSRDSNQVVAQPILPQHLSRGLDFDHDFKQQEATLVSHVPLTGYAVMLSSVLEDSAGGGIESLFLANSASHIANIVYLHIQSNADFTCFYYPQEYHPLLHNLYL